VIIVVDVGNNYDCVSRLSCLCSFSFLLAVPFFLTLLLSGVNMPIIPTHIHLNIDTHVSLFTHEAIPLLLLFVYLQRNAHSFFHYGSLCALFFKFVVGSQLYFFLLKSWCRDRFAMLPVNLLLSFAPLVQTTSLFILHFFPLLFVPSRFTMTTIDP